MPRSGPFPAVEPTSILQSTATARLASADAETLTARETEVLRHVALGLSNRDIAAALSVSEETVKTHVTHVLAKLNVDNRAQAIVQALKRGIVSLDELQ